MLGFSPLVAGSLMLLAGYQLECPPVETAKINIVPKTLEVLYKYDQTMAELQSQKTDTIDPYGFHGMTVTQGFMQGQIKMQPKVTLNTFKFKKLGAVCLSYNSIDVELEIDPQIVIAKEVYRDNCMREAVIEHEMKHVKVDRQIVNKYAQIIGNKIYEGLKERDGFKSIGVLEDEAQSIAERMQRVVFQIAELEYKRMALERSEAQHAVDNLQEYEGVDAKCPGFKMPDNLKTGAKH